MTYVRIRSFHVSTGVSRAGRWMLLCGRSAPPEAETTKELPGDQPTCERCAVLAERQRQREETE